LDLEENEEEGDCEGRERKRKRRLRRGHEGRVLIQVCVGWWIENIGSGLVCIS